MLLIERRQQRTLLRTEQTEAGSRPYPQPAFPHGPAATQAFLAS